MINQSALGMAVLATQHYAAPTTSSVAPMVPKDKINSNTLQGIQTDPSSDKPNPRYDAQASDLSMAEKTPSSRNIFKNIFKFGLFDKK